MPIARRWPNQTKWSLTNIGRFQNMLRSVARITVSRGQGRGAALELVRIRPPADGADRLRSAHRSTARSRRFAQHHFDASDGERSPPRRSRSPTILAAPNPAARDWCCVMIDGTDVDAVAATMKGRFTAAIAAAKAELISEGTYRLMWDLAKSDL